MAEPAVKPPALTMRANFVLYLDALLLLAFLLLLSPRMTGLAVHEYLGVLFVLPILVHLLNARPWILLHLKRMGQAGDRRGKVNLVLNAVLFVLVFIEVYSGLVISQVLAPSLGVHTINDRSWRALHNQTLNITMLFVGLHMALNWEWIAAALRKRVTTISPEFAARAVLSPTWGIALGWTILVVVASAVVGGAAYACIGPPMLARLYVQDEIARFAPTLGHGIVQFLGETFLTAVVAVIGRKWLKVRL